MAITKEDILEAVGALTNTKFISILLLLSAAKVLAGLKALNCPVTPALALTNPSLLTAVMSLNSTPRP